MNRRILRTMGVSACLCGAAGDVGSAPASLPVRPNVILILADDLGWGDVGFNGNPAARTPHLDRMAAEGMILTDFHSNGAACTPTRAALLTGRYQQRSGLVNALFVGNRMQAGIGMAQHERLLPGRLREIGYASAIFGKWHLGGQPGAHPLNFGFDAFIGNIEGHIDYISKWNRLWPDWNRGFERFTEDGYATHLLSGYTVDFIAAKKDRPFFIYLSHACPHTPHMIPGDPPMYGQEGPKKSSQPEKYIRMIEEMDRGIGDILAKLRDLKLDVKTLVIFTSDNGQSREAEPFASAGPFRGAKGDMYEGGHRVPFAAWWPGVIPAGATSSAPAMTMDLNATVLDLAGLPMPGDRPLDGVSLKRLLLDGEPPPPRVLFWDNGRGQAVRAGKWKYVAVTDPKQKIRTRELFDLDVDLGEANDVSGAHPDVAKRMSDALTQWMKDVREGATVQPVYKTSPMPQARDVKSGGKR